MPDVISQLLWWHGIKSFIVFSGFICLFLAAIFMLKMIISLWKMKDKPEWFETKYVHIENSLSVNGFMLHVLCCVLFLISIVGIIASLEWLQILIAPKIFIIEYASELVK